MSAGESGSDAYPDLSQTIIIFLDIDGVLLPFGSHLLFPDAQLEALSIILQAFAEDHAVEIVLSSTWRVQAKFRQDILDQFDAYAYEYGGPLAQVQRFFDVTDIELHSERHLEIDAWLVNKSSLPLAWIALDDEDLLLGGTQHAFDGHVVQTVSHQGLTEENAKLAIQLLQKQLEKKRLVAEKGD
jgi:hypothetical protein